MYRWDVIGGCEWQQREALPDSKAEVGFTIAHGLADEPVEAVGALALAAAVLHRELSLPTGPSQGIADVAVKVNVDSTAVRIRGQAELVAAVWGRLPGLFDVSAVAPDELSLPAKPFDASEPVWPVDALARTGANAFSLQGLASVSDPSPRAVATALRAIDPRSGTAAVVFHSTETSLLGAAFEGPAPAGAAPVPVDPTRPIGPGACSLPAYAPNTLFSADVPDSPGGRAAASLIAHLVAAELGDHDGPIELSVLGNTRRGRLVVSFGAGDIVGPATRYALGLFLAGEQPPVTDGVVETYLAAVELPAPEERALTLRLFALPPDTTPPAAAVRALALDAMRRAHLGSVPEQEELEEFPELLADPPKERGTFYATELNGKARAALGHPPASLRLGQRMLWVDDPGADPNRRVDLHRLVARVEGEDGWLTLIDERLRSLSFIPSTLGKSERLLAELEPRLRGLPALPRAARPGVSKATGAPGSASEGRASGNVDRRRRNVWIALAIMVLVVGGAIAAALLYSHQADATKGTFQRVDGGAQATLGNGATVRVDAPTVTTLGGDKISLSYPVRYCGGGETHAEGVGKDVQNTVNPVQFGSHFVGSQSTGRAAEGVPGQVQRRILAQGECAEGVMVFDDFRPDLKDARQDPTVGVARFTLMNQANDSVTWSFPLAGELGGLAG